MSKSVKNDILYVANVTPPDIKILQYGYTSRADWFFPNMNSPFWYLWRNNDRSCTVSSGGRNYALDPEHYMLIPPFTTFATSSNRQVMTQFHCHFSFPEFPYNLRREPLLIPASTVNNLSAEDFFAQFKENLREPYFLNLWVHSLVCAVMSRIPLTAQASRGDTAIRKYTRLFIEYLHEHYGDKEPYQDFCRLQNISTATLLRSFKKDTNMTPQHYLIMFRLVRAKNYLLETDFTLDEIADLTGFADRYHFSKMFRKYINASPVAFRQKLSCTPLPAESSGVIYSNIK